MANPNQEIWGAPESWIYSPNTTYGLTSTLSQTIHADRPKVAYFGAGSTQGYEGSLLRAINVSQKMTLNEYIDNSICPCGQAPDVSPFAKIAIFNENNDLSTTPRVVTITDNINWFFADKAATVPYYNGFEYFKQYTRQGATNEGLKYQQFAPKANSPASGTNVDMQMCPYTYYGLRSLFLSIEVHCMPKTATNPITQTNWRTLKAWQVNYSETEDIIGLRLYVRTCQSINSSTLELTYSTDKAISYGQQSFVCITNPITINNDGTDTPTQMLSIYNKGQRCAYIFDITGEISAWDSGNDSRTNRAVLPCWDYFDNQTVHTYYGIPSDPVRYYYYKIPYSESTYEKIMSIAALFGCFFTDRNVNVFPYNMLSEYAYLPIIDENGVAHGEYTNGADNANNSLYSKNSIRDIDYNPDAPPHNNYYDHTDLPTSGGIALNWYSDKTTGSLTPHMILGNLFQTIADIADNPNNQQFLFQEPLKNILDYRRILLTQPWGDRPAGSTEVIPLGAFTTAGSQYPFTGYKNFPRFRRVTLGSFSFDREFNNFLDFEPYTQAVLYVPYCGIKQLPMNIFAGHTVNIYMNADNTSGVLQVLIFVDNIEWGTLSGMASEELPLVGETALTAANTKRELDYQQGQLEWSKMIGIGGSIAGASISAANKNPAGLIAQGASALFKNYYYNTQQAELEYQINHTKPEPLTIQKGDSSIDKMNVQYPFIMIQSPVIIGGDTPEKINTIKQTFGHTKGFKCCETGVIGDFSGLTKCSTANLNGISCTYTEKKMLMEALQEGVIL